MTLTLRVYDLGLSLRALATKRGKEMVQSSRCDTRREETLIEIV